MGRQRLGLRVPRAQDAAAVPVARRSGSLWRACDTRHEQPWWYSTRTGNQHPGRFDLERPRGTSYWALDPASALIEAAADPDHAEPQGLTVVALARLALWRVDRAPRACANLADTTVASVPGLTSEVATVVPYSLSWAWADALAAAGRSGVLFRGRFAMAEAVALFGRAGRPGRSPAVLRSPATDHLGDVPPAFRSGIASLGALDRLPRAEPP